MFFPTLKQKLVRATVQIVSINNIYKKLSPAYNFNTNSLRVYMQIIITILQKICNINKSLPYFI